jgi:hypothetical protein
MWNIPQNSIAALPVEKMKTSNDAKNRNTADFQDTAKFKQQRNVPCH